MKISATLHRENQSSHRPGNQPSNRPTIPARELSSRTLCIAAFVCAAVVFLVYSPSLHFDFILDDHRFTADPRIQDSGHIWEYFANYVWAQFPGGPPSFYRPVFLLWVRINSALSGLSAWGWHVLSIGKHLFAAASLGLLAWKLLSDSAAALAVATLFALHPAQTESVCWVTVPDPLMTTAILIAVFCYVRYREGDSTAEPSRGKKSRKTTANPTKRQGRWLAASVVAYSAALFTKETAIVFPLVIVAIDLLANEKRSSAQSQSKGDASIQAQWKPRWKPVTRRIAPFAVATVIYLLLRLNALDGKLGAATQHLSWRTIVLSWPAIVWFYVKVIFWPGKSYAFADPILMESFSFRGVALPLVGMLCVIALLIALMLWIWRRSRELPDGEAVRIRTAVIAGTLLLILPLLPALNLNALNPGDFLHGRYTYMPLAGLMLVLASAWRVSKLPRIALICATGGLAIGFSVLTVAQEKQWKDDATVFTTAHALAPHNAPVARHLADTQVQAALALGQEGRCDEAMPVFERVSREFPEDWYPLAGIAECYVQLNDLVKAEQTLHRAADISNDPNVLEHWQQLRAHMGLPSAPR